MFSKYDTYTSVQSVYCYKGTDVLKNRLDIRDKEQLHKAEEKLTSVKQYILLESPINGRFSKSHLLKIHKFIFEDVYPFAGHIRHEQISKGDTMFYPPNLIDRELTKVFHTLHDNDMLSEKDTDQQIKNLSYIMSELNIIHPFREGNGRSIRELVRCMGLEYGIVINWSNVDRETMLDAAVASVDDSNAFCDVIRECITE